MKGNSSIFIRGFMFWVLPIVIFLIPDSVGQNALADDSGLPVVDPVVVATGTPEHEVFSKILNKVAASTEVSMGEDGLLAITPKKKRLRVLKKPELRFLGAKCGGRDLYFYSMSEFETAPSSVGYFCGSGGCSTSLLTIDPASGKVRVLSDEQYEVIGVLASEREKDCPSILAEAPGIKLGRANQDRGIAALVYKSKDRAYGSKGPWKKGKK